MHDEAAELQECSFKPMISGTSKAITTHRRAPAKSPTLSQSSGGTEEYNPQKRKRLTLSPQEFYQHEKEFVNKRNEWRDKEQKNHY